MATLVLELNIEDSLAADYLKAERAVKDDLNQLFIRFVYNRFRNRKQRIDELIDLMQEIGQEAEANGITEEIIDEILAES